MGSAGWPTRNGALRQRRVTLDESLMRVYEATL